MKTINRPTQVEICFNQGHTPISPLFDDVYFSNQDGLAESVYVFQQGNQLWERWQKTEQAFFVIAETGFGTGLNFFAVVQLFEQFQQTFPEHILKRLFFISFEKYPLSVQSLSQVHEAYPKFSNLSSQLIEQWEEPINGCYRYYFGSVYLDVWFGDILENLPQLGDYMYHKVDAWFLDGFSPAKNPDMWTLTLYEYMYRFTKPQGTLATFTVAGHVQRGLKQAGFKLFKRKGFGHKREMLQGIKESSTLSPVMVPWYLPQSTLTTSSSPLDVAIIGGGIASLFTALSLLEKGVNVTLYCEDSQPALNASGNKQGAIYPQLSDDDIDNIRLYIHSFSYALKRIKQSLNHFTFEHSFCGVALCGYSPKAQHKIDKISALKLPSHLFQACSAQQLSQHIGLPVTCAGGFLPMGGWLAPREFVQRYFTFLQEHYGLKLKTLQKITALSWEHDHWVITNDHHENICHQNVVLANGHKISHFTQADQIPLYSVRGQVSQIPTTADLQKLNCVICYDGYLTPVDQAKKYHCIGASHVRNSTNPCYCPQEQQQNQQKIQTNLASSDWVNQIDTHTPLAHVGIRATLRDRTPIMGNVANFAQQQQDYFNIYNLRRRKQPIPTACHVPNLFVIGGLGSRGLTTSALLGECLASQIVGEPIPLSANLLQKLSPNRSWMRSFLRGR